MHRLEAANLSWQLVGWRPFHWRLRQSMELGTELNADVNPIPVTLPSSVQCALKEAGILPDWNLGMQSRYCEWVEHRHWEFVANIPEGFFGTRKTVRLVSQGLDHSGWILVDGKEVACFTGSLVPHIFDLSEWLGDRQAHHLSIVFDKPPAEQGQIGYSSKSKYFKPRFSYGWDWCPRFVHIGIWNDLYFETGAKSIDVKYVRANLNLDNTTGQMQVRLDANGLADSVVFRLSRNGKSFWEQTETLGTKCREWNYDNLDIEAWWPNGMGEQPLYDFEVIAQCDSQIIQTQRYSLGFKRIEWKPCENASPDALPWICVTNGMPIFLQGVNWTPVAMDFSSVSESDYRHRINLYKEMGCNVLRIWGGAYLEKEIFYQLCDESGILVWQEFPLSSSGLDNCTPGDTEVINELCSIARTYISRLGHHVSKLLWCCGNELQRNKVGQESFGVPLDFSDPCLRALQKVVEEEDPLVRVLPTSSSGPSFYAFSENFGKGIHHDVHGPWQMEGSLEEWTDYWEKDDALFRSETGLAGASSVALIDQYCGTSNPWPPRSDNPYWLHSNSWWIHWDVLKDRLTGSTDREKYESFVELSQQRQARGLAIAAMSCKQRFPRCGGFILWMGHDAFPCLSNTAIIDFEGNPKLAYHALKDVFC